MRRPTRRLAATYLPDGAVRRLRATRDAVRRRVRVDEPAAARPPGPPPARRRARPASVLESVRRGRPLTAGLVAETRSLLRRGDRAAAQALAASLAEHDETATIGSLCSGLVAAHGGHRALAWHHLRGLPRPLWSRYALREFVRCGLDHEPERALAEVRELLEGPAPLGPQRWMELLEAVYGHGDLALAAALFTALDAAIAASDRVDDALLVTRDWVHRWITRRHDQPAAPRTADVSLAVVDYDHPGRHRASANIGDHVQTLASMGHLVRHADLRLTGPQDLVELAEQLRSRVPEHRRLHGADATVQLLTVNRDASEYDEVPEGTFVLAFGWYMHALFGRRYGLPMHRNLHPIFVSFHCNKRDLLTPEAIAWMRAHGPVGCRDWTTVDILLSVDVPAFFSGCLTTTVDTVFPVLPDAFPPAAPIAYVDSPEEAEAAGPDAVQYRHSSDAVRFRSFVGNMQHAIELLETYRRDHRAVVTSRLHCYLPMRSLGAQVDFRPGNLSDIRFAGLGGIDDEAFAAIRDGMNDRLAQVYGWILAGEPAETVYARWRELCAPDVAAARARREAPPAALPEVDLSSEVALARARTSHHPGSGPGDGGAVRHVALRVDRSRARVVQVALAALTARTSVPLHVWLLDTTGSHALESLTPHAHGHAVSLVPVRGLGAGLRAGDLEARERAQEQLELLVLPELLPDADRVAVLPLDAVVLDDPAALVDLDLGDAVLAASAVPEGRAASGFGVVHAAGDRLGERTTTAVELRRVAHAWHRFDFAAFDLDVVVLDLAGWRARRTGPQALGLLAAYDLSPREALHVLLGPEPVAVPARWHVVPGRTHHDDPALLHWRDEGKPWLADHAPGQAAWHGVAAGLSGA